MRIETTELLPRYAFLTPLVRGARVLELGAVDRTFGETSVVLHDRGAASVVSLGSTGAVERARREHGGPGLSFRNVPPAQLAPASFDLALVHDAAIVLADGLPALLARLLAPGGHLVVAAPAGGTALLPHDAASRYAEVLGALRPAFPSIEVATQQALVGWVVTPAAAAQPALAIYDGFGRPEAPAFHLFVCGTHATGLATQTLVPVAATPVLATWGERGAGAVLQQERARVEQLVGELRHARERIAERESWIEGLRHEIETRHETAEGQAAELQVARVKLAKLEREHAEATEALRRVREQMAGRMRELDGARRALDSRTQDLRIAEEELEKAREGAQEVLRERVSLEQELAQARAEIARMADEIAAARAEAAVARERAAALEEELREAGRALATAEESCDRRVADATAALLAGGDLAQVQREHAQAIAELESLRRAQPGAELRAAGTDDPARKLREMEDAVDAALRRAREAEERMRAAERRADAADAARAESVATARRWQLEAETARREAAGVAAGMADREALRRERDEALARAAEEAGRRAAARAQLQREIDRAESAESALNLLQRQVAGQRRPAADGEGS